MFFGNLGSGQLVSVHAEQVVDVAGSPLLQKLLHLMRKTHLLKIFSSDGKNILDRESQREAVFSSDEKNGETRKR